jgi:hypothetical protein
MERENRIRSLVGWRLDTCEKPNSPASASCFLLLPSSSSRGSAPAAAATEPEHAAAPSTNHECQPPYPECGGEMDIVETLAKVPSHTAPPIDVQGARLP